MEVGIIGEGLFVYFHPNDVNVSKFCGCMNKVVIYGEGKKELKQFENKCFRFKNMTC